MNYFDVIENFMQSKPTDEKTKQLQEAVGMLVTDCSHLENKMQAILSILSIDLDQFGALADTVDRSPLIGLITLE